MCGCSAPFAELFTKEGYKIAACRECSLVQLEPTPSAEALEALYSEHYFNAAEAESGYADYASQETEYLATFAEDVRAIQQHVPTGRVLDVGCGYGYFLKAAEKAGFEPYGIDLSDAAVEQANARFRGRVFSGTLDNSGLPADLKFDVVFASHVIEHITEPVEFIRQAAARLRPGGLLVLVTPNIESVLARVSKARWVSFKIPEHVAYYSPKTIRALILRGGNFDVLGVSPAYQHYRLPFVATKLRQLAKPLDRLVPELENTRWLRDRIIRVTSGSLRVVARKGGG